MNSPQDRHNDDGTAQGAGTTRSSAGSSAKETAEKITSEGKAQVDHYRDVAADEVDRLADGARAAASELEDDELGGRVSGHIEDLAAGMNRLSSGLREKSGDELLREVKRIARDNPDPVHCRERGHRFRHDALCQGLVAGKADQRTEGTQGRGRSHRPRRPFGWRAAIECCRRGRQPGRQRNRDRPGRRRRHGCRRNWQRQRHRARWQGRRCQRQPGRLRGRYWSGQRHRHRYRRRDRQRAA